LAHFYLVLRQGTKGPTVPHPRKRVRGVERQEKTGRCTEMRKNSGYQLGGKKKKLLKMTAYHKIIQYNKI